MTPTLLVAADVGAVASALALRLADGAVQQATELRAHAMHVPCIRHAYATHTPRTRHAHATHTPCTCQQADELQRALAALRPLGVAGVAVLRAAIASHLRGWLCAGGAVDGVVTALQVSHCPLAWLSSLESNSSVAPRCLPLTLVANPTLFTTQGAEVATMLLDEANRPTAVAAVPSPAAAPKRERDEAPAADARGAAGGGPAKRAAAPSMSFGPGVAAAAARIIQEPAVTAAAAEQARHFRF